MKYRDCYQMGLKMKVYKWLQTFDEFVVQGELDNHVDEDNEEDDFSSQQAECDNESVKSDQPSNVIMKETEFDGISSGGSLMWNAIVRNSTPFDLDAVGAASDEPPLDYENAVTECKVDADADDGSAEAYEIESAAETPDEFNLALASRPCGSGEDVEAESSAAPEHDDDREARVHRPHHGPCGGGHRSYEQSDYDCLFDADDESEVGHGELALAEEYMIHPHDDLGCISAYERSRPERFEDFKVYSGFKALLADRRGANGICMSDYLETFSTVARMATSQYGDVDTAYLHARLGIKLYLEGLDGYPCDETGMVYMIDKALHGLKHAARSRADTFTNVAACSPSFCAMSMTYCVRGVQEEDVRAVGQGLRYYGPWSFEHLLSSCKSASDGDYTATGRGRHGHFPNQTGAACGGAASKAKATRSMATQCDPPMVKGGGRGPRCGFQGKERRLVAV
ncbi:hypothetical protein ON010_g12080 [Phytophthora cinnamomi]|nr:hypothetical protein ON010_g12080 [Phytophthora cinnamomi]